MASPADTEALIQSELAAYFPASDLGWKPQSVKGNRAMAVVYIDARTVMARLDAVLGIGGWQDEYHVLPDGSVLCQLRVKIDGEWLTKTDVGSPSEQPDGGDRMKAAVSDALKRVAIKVGVGRYLYEFPRQWCDYDPAKRQFVSPPSIPAQFLPPGAAKKSASSPPSTNGKPADAPRPTRPEKPAAPEPKFKDGKALEAALQYAEKKGYKEITEFVVNAMQLRGHSAKVADWKGAQIDAAADFASEYRRRKDSKVTRLTKDQKAKISDLLDIYGLERETTLLEVCKAAAVIAPDFLDKDEAEVVIRRLEEKSAEETAPAK